jgi:hypothetical protein
MMQKLRIDAGLVAAGCCALLNGMAGTKLNYLTPALCAAFAIADFLFAAALE